MAAKKGPEEARTRPSDPVPGTEFSRTRVFVVSEKGKEFVGEVEASADFGEDLVFGEYTREGAVMNATEAEARMVSMRDAASVAGFHEYLRGRGKAAVARLADGGRAALLPSWPARFAWFEPPEPEEPATKRRRTGTDWFQREEERRDGLVLELPAWSTRPASAETAMLFRDDSHDPQREGCYFQDARRKYEFRCGRPGLRRLVALREVSGKTSALLEEELAALEPTAKETLLAEGRKIYAEKPSLKGGPHVTWSNDEYGHAGLRAQYLRLKSLQRFTETYNLVHRAWSVDATARSVLERPRLRVASLGGGPAFELLAVREFCNTVAAAKSAEEPPTMAFHSLDLQPAWRKYAEAVGCHFSAPFDVLKATPDSVLEACAEKELDVLVVSYLLIYCTNDHTADLFAALLNRKLVSLLLISERTHEQDIVRLLLRRGLAVVALMPQAREVDSRQLLVMRAADRSPLASQAPDLLYPNVPFARGT